MSGFVRRKMEVRFKLQPVNNAATGQTTQPTFAESGGSEVVITDRRMSATIRRAGGFSQGQMHLRIFGLSLSLMNQLSTLGKLPLAGRNNAVTVLAGDDVNGMAIVYIGTIANAWANFQGVPDVTFEIAALAGLYGALAPVPPASYGGSASVAVIMSSLAAQLNRTFKNDGVDAVLSNPYLPGTLLDQVQACARAAGIEYDDDGQTLTIWPKGGNKNGLVPLLSPATGLVGYPAFTQSGISLTTLFNPSVTFGGLVKVESSLQPAVGTWRVYNLAHQLDADMPDGQWFTHIEAADPRYAPVR